MQGKDVAVVMPTGGGKSLCYQLPALVSGKTVVVISPLISLMQDQAAQLALMGIPAAVINSSQSSGDQQQVMRGAMKGAYRLLYLSPERLARADTVAWLQKVPVAFFAIDEAHCISEWGHEFRPEYRQLSRLRDHFPTQPIAAFTASATKRVRHDILDQLHMREPDKYIASFHRPNLRYLVKLCEPKSQEKLLISAVRSYPGSNIIIYAPTIARVEETVDTLGEHGIAALAYHGQMEGSTRQRNQERWMADEVRVLVGTIAFGLGINKAAVRAVIHLSLPKSIEQYYQEAGRAGRDGLQADCALLWQNRDAGLLAYFIEKLGDPNERERAWQRYHAIRRFAEGGQCRHRQICLHFGETPKWESCGMCDVCAELPDWMAGKHVKAAASAKATAGVSKPAPAAKKLVAALPAVDLELMELLREWRRETARRTSVPAYIVLTDASLDDICRQRPGTVNDLLGITGIGVKKAELYGQEILGVLRAFDGGSRAVAVAPETRYSPAAETIQLLEQGRTFAEIAQIRNRQLGTVVNLVADLVEKKQLVYCEDWVRAEYRDQIEAAAARLGVQWLKPIKEAMPAEVTFEEVRLIVAKLRALAV